VTKRYTFEGGEGTVTLPELFKGSSQLVVYHFMYPPEWDAGCPHCSFWADSFNGSPVHLRARDISFEATSRAPYPQLAAYQKRMSWTFPWYSIAGSDFNRDFSASFAPEDIGNPVYNYGSAPGFRDREGISVFYRNDPRRIFHTYSTYARGIDPVNATYQLLDLTPKGRDESAGDDPQFWVRRHDEY
jgi:predicted dithiol-disulfide oxidoreductase (DUF899 family)